MLNTNCGIYAITGPSGKQYIGSAQDIKARWRQHKHELRKGAHHCIALQRAFAKYGESALRFDIIALVPRDDLITREQEQIDERRASGLAGPE